MRLNGVVLGTDVTAPSEVRQALSLGRAAGATWVRIGVRWRAIEKHPRITDWTTTDSIVGIARELGFHVLAVLNSTPPWASSASDSVIADTSTRCVGRAYSRYPPKDFELWRAFVHRTATRYMHQIDAWQIWNEPDLDNHIAGSPCRALAWCGAPGAYAKLLADAARTIRAVDSTSTIVFAGLAMTASGKMDFLERVLGDVENPAAKFFDVASFHYYGDPLKLRETYSRVLSMLEVSRAAHKRVWLTETGSSSVPSERLQVDYLLSISTQLQSVGIERGFWFQLIDAKPVRNCPSSGFASYGLINANLEPKEALKAFRGVGLSERSSP